MNRICSWLAGLFFLGCVAFGVLLWRQQREMERAAATRNLAERTVASQTSDLHRQIAAAKAGAERKLASAERLQADGGAKRPANLRTVHMSDILKEHPELAALQALRMRRSVLMQYGSALDELGLPPDREAKLKELLVDRLISQNDFRQSAQAAGLQPFGRAVQDALKQATADVDQQIGDLLGADGKAALRQLQELSSGDNMVQGIFSPDFANAGVPLTPDQARQLSQAIVDARTELEKNPPASTEADPETHLNSFNQLLLGKAAQALSPAQLEILRTDQAMDNQRSAIYQQYRQGGSVPIP